MSENDFLLIRKLSNTSFPPDGLIQKCIVLDSIPSTNDYAKKWIQDQNQPAGTLIIADQQTSGRGRFDRQWYSPPGTGLWFSVILRPEIHQQEWFAYSFLSALLTAKTLERTGAIHIHLKWPNDVLINGKKCCGILIETVWKKEQPYLIIGTGINVGQTDFPEYLKSIATSLCIESRNKYNRYEILLNWIDYLNQYRYFQVRNIMEEWKKRSNMFGKLVTIHDIDSIYDAVAEDLDNDGSLVIFRNGNRTKIYAGDVKLKLKENFF